VGSALGTHAWSSRTMGTTLGKWCPADVWRMA